MFDPKQKQILIFFVFLVSFIFPEGIVNLSLSVTVFRKTVSIDHHGSESFHVCDCSWSIDVQSNSFSGHGSENSWC